MFAPTINIDIDYQTQRADATRTRAINFLWTQHFDRSCFCNPLSSGLQKLQSQSNKMRHDELPFHDGYEAVWVQ